MGSMDIMKLFSAVLSINLCNIREKFLGMPSIEPGAAGWEARMLPMCCAAPYCFSSLVPGARVSPFEAVLALRERLHFWQVRVLLERQRLGHHDRLLQQLLQDVRSELQEGGHLRGVQGNRETQNHSEAPEGTSLRNSWALAHWYFASKLHENRVAVYCFGSALYGSLS